MTRKEYVEKAFDIIAYKPEEETLIALSYFAKALQATSDDSYTNSQIEFYVILLNLYHKQPNAEKHIKEFIGENIHIRYNNSALRPLIQLLKEKVVSVFTTQATDFFVQDYLDNLINHDLASMWIKSIKYDAFLAKYQAWRDKKSIEKQELLQIEQMFESFDNDLLK